MHQTLDALGHADERPERHELGDLAVDDLAGLVLALELLPGVLLGRLQRQRDALALEVDVEHLDLDLLADLRRPRSGGRRASTRARTRARARRRPPRSTNAPKFTIEETVPLRRSPFCSDSRNFLRPSLCDSSRKARRESTTLLRLRSSSMILASSSGPDERMQVADAAQLHQRRGQEPAQPDVQDQAALDDLDDRALDRAARLHDLLDPAPGALVLRALLRQDQAALLVLLLEDEGLDVVADLDDLGGVDVVADRQFLGGDDAFGLVADVQQDLVAVDLHDRPLDDVPVLEVPQRGLDGLTELFGREVPHLARRLDLEPTPPAHEARTDRPLGFAGVLVRLAAQGW